MAKSKQPKPDQPKPITQTQTYVVRVPVEASGWQMWSINATSEKEAIEKVKTEGGEFYGEEIEVGSCDFETADAWVEEFVDDSKSSDDPNATWDGDTHRDH